MSGKETCRNSTKFICSFNDCDKSFGRHSRFLIHLRTHTGEKPFVCEYQDCGKAYARAQHLKRHVDVTHSSTKTVSESKKYSCALSDCEKSFVSEDNLKRHMKTVHGKQYKVDRKFHLQCSKGCKNNKFEGTGSLRLLKLSARCTVEGCKKKFTEENQLKRHESQHDNSNPYKCLFPNCNYSCKIAHQLKRHSKIHEGYKCTEEGCDVKLETWSLLRKHFMIQHPKVFECEDCHQKFKKKIQLKRHRLVHSSDQTLFECEHEGCERAYLDLRNLRAHIKSYHDGHRLHCTHEGCSQTFVNKAKLLQHSKLHDPSKPPPKKMPKKGHRKKSAVDHLSNLIEGSSSLVPVSDGDCSDVDKILLNDSGVVVDCSGNLTTISAVTSLEPKADTTVSLESFTKDVNLITSLRNNSNSGSVQSSQNLNDSSHSLGSDSSQNLLSETQFYQNEELEEKHSLSNDTKLDAVDVWLEAMAENIAADTTTANN